MNKKYWLKPRDIKVCKLRRVCLAYYSCAICSSIVIDICWYILLFLFLLLLFILWLTLKLVDMARLPLVILPGENLPPLHIYTSLRFPKVSNW